MAIISMARKNRPDDVPDFFQQAGSHFNCSPSFRQLITERAEQGDKVAVSILIAANAQSEMMSAQH